MTIQSATKSLGKILSDNAPALLTAFGAVGVVTTTVMAVKATPRAMELLDEERFLIKQEIVERGDYDGEPVPPVELSIRETIKIAWKPYVPAVLMGGSTIACILGANSVHSRRQAALMGMYSLADKSLQDYRDKVTEVLGEKTSQDVQQHVDNDRVLRAEGHEVIVLGTGKVLCFDTLTARYFDCDVNTLEKAQNDINRQCINEHYASQNDWYRAIGIKTTPLGDEFGWNTSFPLEIQFSSVLTDDYKPCLAINYRVTPKKDYRIVW